MEKQPLIFITNDDGIRAKGLTELTEVMRQFGRVIVVAPEVPMSGMSGAISADRPLRLTQVSEEHGLSRYQCSGTPVDCVKMGINELLDDRPDFLVSGINHGTNSSVSVLYSGTMGAAIEGCLHGIPSVGFSLGDYDPDADFSEAKRWIYRIFKTVTEQKMPDGNCLNVNVPRGKVEGIAVCRQAKGKWVEELDKRTDPHQHDYYWLSGYFRDDESGNPETDITALRQQKISIVPVRIDMTDYQSLSELRNWKFNQ